MKFRRVHRGLGVDRVDPPSLSEVGPSNYALIFYKKPVYKKERLQHTLMLWPILALLLAVSLYSLLHPLSDTTQKLQGRALDIVMAYQEINTVIEDMTEIRNNIETVYKRIYDQAVRIAEKMDVEPMLPRIAKRQQNRNNVQTTDTPEDSYIYIWNEVKI